MKQIGLWIYIAYKLAFKCETAATEITLDQSMIKNNVRHSMND